jgi:hypothetical protein
MDAKIRERSINNLQRIYTVVVSLSIAESLRRLLSNFGDQGISPSLTSTVAVISLLVTIVPFYHGANRYLDATYVTGEREAKSQALMLDFIAIFSEGLIFFILSLIIQNTRFFFSLLGILFVLDAIWVGITKLTSIGVSDQPPRYRSWAAINILAAVGIFVSMWSNLLNWEFWPTPLIQTLAVGGITILRTVYDYSSVWNFYYPPLGEKDFVLPAPRPAPIPKRSNMESQKS